MPDKKSKLVPKVLTVEAEYQLYLKRIKLSEDKMHPQQKQQVRDAFFAGYGSLLVMMMDDIVELPEEQGDQVLTGMLNEVTDHFKQYVTEPK